MSNVPTHAEVAPPTTTSVEALYDDHGAALFAVARLLLDDLGDARGVVVDVLIENGRRQLPGQDVRRYLACQVYLGCVRARMRRHAVLPESEAHTLPPRAVRHTSAVPGLAELSEQQRAAVALCLYGEHTYVDVADTLSLPPPVVTTLLRSGLRKLRAAQRAPGSERA